ncbi:6-O-methylguanine DNA methyltransferase [Methylopila jiangsuensis]|uniref:methylated-DNA--[protein]-cysteine S-methyltransferase n=1 Tax=Methylopila jiangsuensis TaxID=586230 RepID=A0A9W6JI58_9HYPH|nr:methylated-DNA--[protein]-cysteine S-methyltransferase [Methylopila jiangsuensis]MDR6285131.1 AraC family transcriptional regulator of adaptative response/methylated-DNA-[protein]-cysteine methyltransferase [Methylopila jiangsuensis]GLK77482.1 6-O-methylguanine DNA methyltransferase [Methylopila jiangsuensis]
MPPAPTLTALASVEPAPSDYDVVRRALEHLTTRFRDQPSTEEVAAAVGLSPSHFNHVFRRWCGLSPKAFLQAVTLDRARGLLRREEANLLDAAYELGLSGPARLHDLFVTHEAMSPGAFKAGGAGLDIRWGVAPSPFGLAVLAATERGLCGLGFADDEAGVPAARDDLAGRWPAARLIRDDAHVAAFAAQAFDPAEWRPDRPLRLVLIGADFQVEVWRALLSIPLGQATTYGRLAETLGRPKAARAVGAAVGRNPISFVVPCHRVVGASGALTGYHWGLTRKRAMLGWETGDAGRGSAAP